MICALGVYAVAGAYWVFIFVLVRLCHITEWEMREIFQIQVAEEIPRKSLCACGSGKKYKNCCGSDEHIQDLLWLNFAEDGGSYFLVYGKRMNAQLYYLFYPVFRNGQWLICRLAKQKCGENK